MTPPAMPMVAIGANCKSGWLGLDGVDATSIHMLDVCACVCLPFFFVRRDEPRKFQQSDMSDASAGRHWGEL